MKSRIFAAKLRPNGPKWLKSLSKFNLQSDILSQIRGKIHVNSDGIRYFASIHVFTEQELQDFIQKIEKRVYNNIACAKTKGNC